MISKELLSQVLGVTVLKIELPEINTLYYEWNRLCTDINGTDINIYELAHRCKEWALKQGYKIRIEAYDYMEDNSFSGTYWWITRLRPKTWQEEGCPNCGANNTEPEAIFKACQWILDNKE